MQKGKKKEQSKAAFVFEVDPTECPFREFRDQELSVDYWGLGPAACRAAVLMSGKIPKPPADFIWVDEQTQPLPRSVRQYLHGWIRAEDLALERWDAEVVVFEENNGGKMSVIDMQLSHTQVLMRSSFCRQVLSACYMLERAEGLQVEHQWEQFVCNYGPEGWRAKYHIYSPSMKAGGGSQHRPGLSKNGWYLVRLFYLGTWRCVWVSDQIPVDATDSPLLPFSPLMSRVPPVKGGGVKTVPSTVTANVVYLWPLLICKVKTLDWIESEFKLRVKNVLMRKAYYTVRNYIEDKDAPLLQSNQLVHKKHNIVKPQKMPLSFLPYLLSSGSFSDTVVESCDNLTFISASVMPK